MMPHCGPHLARMMPLTRPKRLAFAPASAGRAGCGRCDPTAQAGTRTQGSADTPRPLCARSDPSSIAHCSWCTYTGICKGCVAPYALVNNTCACPAGTSFDGTTCASHLPALADDCIKVAPLPQVLCQANAGFHMYMPCVWSRMLRQLYNRACSLKHAPWQAALHTSR